MRRVTLALAFLSSAIFAGGGCEPPVDDTLPTRPFDPGTPGSSNGSGSGSGSGGGGGGGGPVVDPGPPMCDPALRRCPAPISYPSSGRERTVEVIGDWAPGAWTRGVALTLSGSTWTGAISVPWSKQVLYKFHVVYTDNTEKWLPDPGNPNKVDDGYNGFNSVMAPTTCARWTCASTQITCAGGATGGYDWRDAVLYFVFVDRFLNGKAQNDAPLSVGGLQTPANWQGGDWVGVKQKIDSGYFQSLGVNALWLSVPIDSSESAGIGDDGQLYSGYHGYWPRDLSKTERRLGTDAELQALIDAAHTNGMKVIVDYAMNHVHEDSAIYQQHKNDGWFNPLRQANQDCICGDGACKWEGQYAKTCWFRSYLPDFNFNNAAARDYSVTNALDWIVRFGFDGFRLDALKHIETSWLEDLRRRLTRDVEPMLGSHVYLVGETFTGDRDLLKSYVDPCTKLDGQFDFPLRATLLEKVLMRRGTMGELASFMDGNESFYGAGLMSTFIGNHDVPRVIHYAEDVARWGDAWANGKDKAWSGQPGTVGGTSAYERVSVAMAILMTSRGVPLIYYGDEVGMPGAGDPDNRRFMQWSNYSAGQTLLLERMKKLGAARKAHVALRRGTRATLGTPGSDTWAYSMTEGSDRVFVVVNRGDGAATVGGLPSGALRDEISGETVSGPSVSVPARSFRVLVQ
jgi:glycosidase